MGDIVSGITDAIGLTDTEDAGDNARKASRTAAAAQTEALDYLKEVEALPQALREGALRGLGGEYGLTFDNEGNVISDGSTISQRALASPMYTTGVGLADDAVMRNAAMTGGLRSGNTQDALGRANQALYLQSYGNQLQGLGNFAKLPSNANTIASGISGIGNTLAQGQVAQSQANVAAQNQLFNDVVSVGTMVAGGMGGMPGGAGVGGVSASQPLNLGPMNFAGGVTPDYPF